MKLVILHSSDTHGFLMPTDYQDKNNYDAPISLSRVSSVVKSEKEKNLYLFKEVSESNKIRDIDEIWSLEKADFEEIKEKYFS